MSYGGNIRQVYTPCGVTEERCATSGDFGNFVAVWDTGASRSVISNDIVRRLGIEKVTESKTKTMGGEVDVDIYVVDILLPGGMAIPSVTVSSGILDGFDVLVGMDIISLGDFAITGTPGHKAMTFRVPSTAVIDLVDDTRNVYKYYPPTRGNIGAYDYSPGYDFPIVMRRQIPWWRRIFGSAKRK